LSAVEYPAGVGDNVLKLGCALLPISASAGDEHVTRDGVAVGMAEQKIGAKVG